jgi:DNA-binding MarR family transcriptional regulator
VVSTADVEHPDPNVLFALWRLARQARALVDQTLADHELTSDEFGIYSLLYDLGEATPSMLERWMSAPPTSVSSYIKRLEGRGHLSRFTNPDDGRSTLLRLTPAGAKIHEAATADYLPALDLVVEALGRHEPKVLAALAKLREAIEEARSRQSDDAA